MNADLFLTLDEQRVADNRKIEAIKIYRERTGVSLPDAKREVEDYLSNPDLYKSKRLSHFESLDHIEVELLGDLFLYESVSYKIQRQLDRTQFTESNEVSIEYLVDSLKREREKLVNSLKSHVVQYAVTRCSSCTSKCACEEKDCKK